MKNGTLTLLLMSLLVALGPVLPGAAQDNPRTPFMLSFVTPLQVPTRDFDVAGLRLNLVYGECRNFQGLDIGAVGRATGNSKGIHLALLATVTDGDAVGLHVGTVSYVKGQFNGLQLGAVNYASRAGAGQIGIFNGADHITGFQIGVINVTKTMIGVQIGVVNVIRDNDVPFVPIINGYF
jgi:hypothetical protein